MRKLKILLLILLTVALLIAGANLPRIIAAVQDGNMVNHFSFGEMDSISLDFSEPDAGEPETSSSLLEKLALIRDGSFYDIPPDNYTISQSDIEEIVKAGLAPYYDVNLIPEDWRDCEVSALPYMVYSSTPISNYGILWVVTIHWPQSGDNLELYVDDETGRILYLHYNTTRSLDLYTDRGYLIGLSNAYFTSTGISEILEYPEAFGVEWVEFDDSGLNAKGNKFYSYSFYHPDYASISIQFWLYDDGFYTLIRNN